MAYVKNGHVYHTAFDTPSMVQVESVQRVGTNLLALVRNLLNNNQLVVPERPEQAERPEHTGGIPPSESRKGWQKGRAVYFDVLGLYIIVYSERVAIVLNLLTVLLAFFFTWLHISQGSFLNLPVNFPYACIMRKSSQNYNWSFLIEFELKYRIYSLSKLVTGHF